MRFLRGKSIELYDRSWDKFDIEVEDIEFQRIAVLSGFNPELVTPLEKFKLMDALANQLLYMEIVARISDTANVEHLKPKITEFSNLYSSVLNGIIDRQKKEGLL